MTDEDLIAQGANVPTMYFDGFGAYQKINGVLRCIGYVLGSGAQLNLIVSLVGADDAQQKTRRAIQQPAPKDIIMWAGMNIHH